jgi:hypothetical protein
MREILDSIVAMSRNSSIRLRLSLISLIRPLALDKWTSWRKAGKFKRQCSMFMVYHMVLAANERGLLPIN